LDDFQEVMFDFLQQSGLVKKLINIHMQQNVSVYAVPDHAMDVQEALFDDRYIYRTFAFDMDQTLYAWRTKAGTPLRWHEDRLNLKQVEVQPKPNADGYTVDVTAAFYGTISSVTAGTINVTASAPFYGTISSYTSSVYLETPVGLFGTISEAVSSNRNLTLVATGKQLQKTFALTDLIEILPTSFIQYVKYGVLEMCFGRDGETRDVFRQRYAAARYEEGISLARAISGDALDEEMEVA
jgi:hypothetical protein